MPLIAWSGLLALALAQNAPTDQDLAAAAKQGAHDARQQRTPKEPAFVGFAASFHPLCCCVGVVGFGLAASVYLQYDPDALLHLSPEEAAYQEAFNKVQRRRRTALALLGGAAGLTGATMGTSTLWYALNVWNQNED